MDLSKIAKALGRKGGNKTVEKYGKDYFKRLSELGVKARQEKKKQKENLT